MDPRLLELVQQVITGVIWFTLGYWAKVLVANRKGWR